MKTSLITFLLLTFTVATFAQQRGKGLIFDEAAFNAIPTLPTPDQGAKSFGDNLPIAFDLSKYCPPAGNQGSVPSCVAWSTAYSAFATQYAAKKGITDPNQIQRLALSAMLPYKQLRPGCDAGLNISDIAMQLVRNGNLPYSEFGINTCMPAPSSDMVSRARQNRPVQGVVSVFKPADTEQQKFYATQRQLAIFKTPVIVGIQTTENLNKLTASDDYYRPGGREGELHAVTVVGYDAVSFKILNSWGPSWGRNGLFSVRFEDFKKIAVAGMALTIPDDYNPGPNPAPTKTQIGGTFAFQYLDSNTGSFNQVTPSHTGNGIYEMSRKDWQVGDRFQLLTSNDRAGQYICVFSINPKNEVKAHYPLNTQLAAVQENSFGLGITDLLPAEKFDLVIPAVDKVLVIQEPGTDYLCVLYSNKPLLNDIPYMLTRIQNSNASTLYGRLQEGVGSRLIPARNINYQSSRMGASATTGQGDIFPLILKVQSVR
ncbi:C1 family peptidase [Spirosoma fluviale]|uniref:Papain family cysteine protease n=1 Tax=Spirosoma fluviale TaxID=1597977 RepID=A0A286GLQ9_9BACT|nr:C1 family peptidase [Spirosoma fluviale]SOD96450.1 Papain family cysteine protease [Spirosoma fluviale]